MTTLAANKEQGELALSKLKEKFGGPYADDMELHFDESIEDREGNPYCEIHWPYGPYGWSYIGPKDFGFAEGIEFRPANDWPENLWTEARDGYVMRVWAEV